MPVFRPTTRVIALVFGVAIALLLVPFVGNLFVDSEQKPREQMVLGGPHQEGGIPTVLKCSHSPDLTKLGLYHCSGTMVDSRIDRTGKDMENTLHRVVRSDPTLYGFRAEEFSYEKDIYRLEGKLGNGDTVVVLSKPYSGEYEGVSMYVTLRGKAPEHTETIVRTAMEEADLHEV